MTPTAAAATADLAIAAGDESIANTMRLFALLVPEELDVFKPDSLDQAKRRAAG